MPEQFGKKEVGKDLTLTSLLEDNRVLTAVEDKVVRNGEPKAMARSLEFFAAQDIGTARYLENGVEIKLYDIPGVSKPCELSEAQASLEEFANKYNKNPKSISDRDALDALAELSDVAYNLAQLVGEDEFETIVNTFSAQEDLFTHLLVIAKAKYTYRYLDVTPEEAIDFTRSSYKSTEAEIFGRSREKRVKDINIELDEVLMPIFGSNNGFLTDLLVRNWDHINTTLGAVYSAARTVAEELDTKEGLSHDSPISLLNQLIPALRRHPVLQTQQNEESVTAGATLTTL
jgi:hypothetical protein